jgi:hypothetical protein
LTACLSVNLLNAECFFQGINTCKAEDVAQYLADTTQILQQQGYQTIHYFLDRATTHKDKMQNYYTQLTQEMPVKTIFHLLPAYSPQVNLVEYLIHLVRLKYLHHADCKQDLVEVEFRLSQALHRKQYLTEEQIINILQHIQDFAFKS